MEELPQEKENKYSIKAIKSVDSNPFKNELLELACISARKKNHKEVKPYTNEQDGDIQHLYVENGDISYFWHDTCPFTKVYKGTFKDMLGLSKPALNLFYMICDNLKVNSEFVKLSPQAYDEYTETNSKGAYYQAIVELCKKRFIAKYSSDVYFVNYTKIFNGSRTELLGGEETAKQAYYEKNKSKL